MVKKFTRIMDKDEKILRISADTRVVLRLVWPFDGIVQKHVPIHRILI